MKIPEAFHQLTGTFDPDLRDDVPEGEDLITYGLGLITARDRSDVKKFLNKILDGNLTDKELADIWLRASSRTAFHNEADYRVVLEKIRQKLSDS